MPNYGLLSPYLGTDEFVPPQRRNSVSVPAEDPWIEGLRRLSALLGVRPPIPQQANKPLPGGGDRLPPYVLSMAGNETAVTPTEFM